MAKRQLMLNLFLFTVGLGTLIIVFLFGITSIKGGSYFHHFKTYIQYSSDVKRNRVPVDTAFLTDEFLQNNPTGKYPNLSPCPYLHLRKASTKSKATGNQHNVSCQIHMSSEDACKDAVGYFGRPDVKLERKQCIETHYPDICYFETKNMSHKLKCNPSVCKNNEVSLGAIDDTMGIITKWEPVTPFDTNKVLEFVELKISQNHSFCYIKCGFIEQVLIFPPKIIKNSTVEERNKININIIVLDCISRPHFFRVMRESVEAMRTVIYDDSINATVLDFELFQSISMHTFDNIRPLFSGVVQGNEDFSSASLSLHPLGIHVLSNEFKTHGYQTVFTEDLCWHDSWGIMLNNLVRSGGAVNAKSWQTFKDVVKQHNLDHIGITHMSCEVFKKYGYTNHYDQPDQVCLNGRFFNSYYLRYLKTLIEAIQNDKEAAPLLLYQHFNSAHTDTGTRIRNDDPGLADFILSIARDPNSLTIFLSDHGHTRTGYAKTEEGKRELYHPLLFMIIPHYVAGLLGKQRMEALVANQNRIFTTYDIHKALMSLHDDATKFSTNYKVNGVFSKIPSNRTCSDLPLMPLARCQCEGSVSKVQDNSNTHRWLAEFALGSLNNIIQEQFSKGTQNSKSKTLKGFGNCVRYVGTSFRNIIQSIDGKMTTLDLHINSKTVGLKEDEVIAVAVELKDETPILKSYVRQTMYNKFKECVDKTVDLKICVCDKRKTLNSTGTPRILKTSEMKKLVSSSMFGTESEIKDLHEGCLLQVIRQHSSKTSVVYEVANSCQGKTFSINVEGRLDSVFTSRPLPFTLTVEPNSIYFMFSAVRRILNLSYMNIKITATKV